MTTLLVDGNNLLARADFAAKGGSVEMSVDGVNTASLVIFVNMLSKYVRLTKPTRVLVCWDAGHRLRDEAYPAYKANRKPHVEGTERIPFAQAREFLTWAGVPHRTVIGYEADDLIAATCRQVTGEVVILSGDKDLLQLVNDHQGVTQIRVPDTEPMREADVDAKVGVPPHQMPSYMALVGDAGDGVPGVRGIGPKKAAALLAEAEWDWEALLTLLGPEKAQQAVLMRSLVDLRYFEYDAMFMGINSWVPDFVPTAPPVDMCWPMLEEFCQRYRLNSIRERLEGGTLWAEDITPRPSHEGLFDDLDLEGDTPSRSA